MKKIYLTLVLLPSLAFANIGDDLNELFDSFFGTGQEPIESDTSEIPVSNALEIPETEVTENPTEKDLQILREQIEIEENILNDFNEQIETQESELWAIGTKKNSFRTQLEQLDTQIGINSKKLEAYRTHEKKWKKLLESITRKRSEIKAEVRIREEAYQKLMSRNYIRQQQFDSGEDVSLVKWLFSKKTVAQILEEKQQQRYQKTQQQTKLKQLKRAKQKLESEEKQSALLYQKLADLNQRISREKINLEDFATGRANLIANLEKSQSDIEEELANYRRQKNESAIYLQNLHLTLDQTREKLQEKYDDPEAFEPLQEQPKDKVTSFFQWPLDIPIKVTAHFRDPEYKKSLGRAHDGVDLFAPQGTDLFAPADGTVTKIGVNNFGYSYLILKHKNGLYTVYGHLSSILVTKDQFVKQGALIGKTGGAPGTKGAGYFTTGPHLHLELFRDGNYLNPLHYLPEVN